MAANWLIVGLGNPGREYERTRHNLGFMLVDKLAAETGTSVRRDECRSLVGRTLIENLTVELAKPQTYMNLSGEAVRCLLAKEGRSRETLIVVSDDLVLPLGTIRLRPKGSHGGHNGLRSIIEQLGSEEFIRLRIGIAPEHPVADARSFVLQNFAKSELETVEDVLERGIDAVGSVVTEGIERAMARHN